MRRILAVLLAAIGMVAAGSGVAGAHAGFVSSEPADGASLERSPEHISVSFTEPPDLGLTQIELIDAGGGTHALGPLRAQPPHGVIAPVTDPLADGVYTVTWRVVSTDDGHVTAGAFSFAVGEAMPPRPGAGPDQIVTKPTPLSVGAKGALYVGLSLLLAAGVVGLWVLGGRPARTHIVAVLGGLIAFAGAVGLLVAEQQAVDAPMRDLIASPTGRPFVLMVGTTFLAAIAAALGAMKPSWRRLLWGGSAAAAVTAFLRASSGHAAATDLPLLQESLQWAHMVAAGLWIGGLVLLVLMLREREEAPIGSIRRFSSLALIAVGVIVLTGSVRSMTQLGGPGALLGVLDTGYARVLVIKVTLALGLIGLGAVNRMRSIPRLPEAAGRLRRLATIEVAVAAVVFLLTAVLTGLNPPVADAGPSPPSTLGTAEGTDFARTTHVTLTATPGTPGTNAFRVTVTDPDDGSPLDVDGVVLRFRSATRPDLPPSDVPLTPEADAWVGHGTDVSVAGTWDVTARTVTGAEATEVPMVLITRSDAEAEPVPGVGFVTASYPSGVAVQLSVEDAEGSTAFVHVTALAPDGSELELSEVAVVATPAGDRSERLDAELVTDGHAIAQATLEPGAWTIDAVVTASDGRAFQATVIDVPLG